VTSRRLALILLLVGSLGILGTCALTWVTATVSVIAGVGTREFTATGTQLLPSATAWAILALAGSLAFIALRGWIRQAVGVLIGAVGVVLAVQALMFGLDPVVESVGETLVDVQIKPWWVLVVVCAVLVIAAGVLAVGWSRCWPALGARYEGESTRRQRPTSPWDALDAGQDPTMSDPDGRQWPA